MRAAQMRFLHWKLGLRMRCKCSLGLFVQRWNCLKYLLVVSLPTPCAAYSQAFSVNASRWRIRDKLRGGLQTLSDHMPDPKRKGRAECGGLGTRQVEGVTNRWFSIGCLVHLTVKGEGGRHTRHTEIPIIATSCLSYVFLDNSPQVKSPSIQVEKITSHLKPNKHEDVFKWSVRALPWKQKTIKAQFVDSK